MILIKPFGEESSTTLLIIYLFLGFSGFFLFILLISMVFVTLAQEDQILLINTEDEDNEDGDYHEGPNDIENCDQDIKVLKQSEKPPNQYQLKVQKVKTKIVYFVNQVAHFPLLVYYYFIKWKQDIDNDFIILK